MTNPSGFDWDNEYRQRRMARLAANPPDTTTMRDLRARVKVLEEALEEIRDGYTEGKSLEWMYGTAVAALSPELVEEALS